MSPAFETAVQTVGRPHELSEPPPPPWIAPSADQTGGSALAALAGTPIAARFCSWAGLSGRRYVFSVYPAAQCPAFCHAVLIAATADGAGRRRILSVRDTGAFPEPVVARARRELRSYGAGLEFHVHLLSSSQAERQAAVADLASVAGRALGDVS